MKKIISFMLVVLMIFSFTLMPVGAAEEKIKVSHGSKVPIIRICGDGAPLEDAEGNEILNYKGLLNGGDDDGDNSEIIESVMNVIAPFLIDGLATDNWDPYYDALYKEIAELFEGSLLDENGNAAPGDQPYKYGRDEMAYSLTHNRTYGDGTYSNWSYQFFYDWRLDPYETAVKLKAYVEGVKKITGFEKVAIIGSCIGSASLLAYIEKFGTDDFTFVGLEFGTVGGAEILSNPISGNFHLDGEAINRFLKDCEAIGLFSLDDFITSTINLAIKAGVVEGVTTAVKETLYEKLVEGVTSSLALSTFYTYPSYWSCVKSEDYETAKNYVFGPEGSEKRRQYAGLIEKLDNYDLKVRQCIPEILKEIDDNICLGILAKYGFQIAPITKDPAAIGDQFSSLTCASFGATTSKIYNTLSDDYIAKRVAEGKGKYISPDKQVDASTCLYPDYTWILKGASHSLYTEEEQKLFSTLASYSLEKQLTIDDLEFSQFMVYDYESNKVSNMTEENCNTYNWKVKEESKEGDRPKTLMEFLTALFNWLTALIKKFFG